MLFQSQYYLLIFMPLVLLSWYALPQLIIVRISFLIVASLVFYGWFEPRFVVLLVLQASVAWLLAEAYVASGRRADWVITVAITLNVAAIAFFKYTVFFIDNVAALFSVPIQKPNIILPIGISFFTFEIISYLADLRWHNAPRYSFNRFLLFVCFFPRLIAGPIVRHHEIIPQFDLDPRREGVAKRFSLGVALLTLGLAKKVFLADKLAPIVDAAFADAARAVPSFGTAWSGALAFTFQLFLDFSAYSEMAIGIALMLGIALPQNFSAPYQATNLADFWRRWHMTLSRYLRDYVYIPLGGSRHGQARTFAAILATMGLCGLWHGAGWTYVVWGLWHGIGLIALRVWTARGAAMPTLAAWPLTFLFVVVGWVIFRAPTFEVAMNMLEGMAGLHGLAGSLSGALLISIAAVVSIAGPTTYHVVTRWYRPQPAFAVATALLFVAVVLEVGAGQPKTFIYFQF